MDKKLKEFQDMLDGKREIKSINRKTRKEMQKILVNFNDKIFSVPIVNSIFQSIDIPIVILNLNNQIVFMNQSSVRRLNFTLDKSVGLKVGEVFYCQNAVASTEGCGTSENCQGCKFSSAVIEVWETGLHKSCDFEILNQKKEIISFKVYVTRFNDVDEKYLICSFVDESILHEKKFLENIFLHDVKNRISILQSASEVIKNDFKDKFKDTEVESLINLIYEVSNKTQKEIESYKQFLDLEDGIFELEKESVDIGSLMASIIRECEYLQENKQIGFLLDIHKVKEKFLTDKTLLSRAILNAMKNAIEASNDGDKIKISIGYENKCLEIEVNNPAVIPIEVQRSLFNRVTSTKGIGRGYGCFSIKIVVERFLKGEVRFNSNKKSGTTICIKLPELSVN